MSNGKSGGGGGGGRSSVNTGKNNPLQTVSDEEIATASEFLQSIENKVGISLTVKEAKSLIEDRFSTFSRGDIAKAETQFIFNSPDYKSQPSLRIDGNKIFTKTGSFISKLPATRKGMLDEITNRIRRTALNRTRG